MMPKIVLPHWLRATKLWKHSKTTSFLLKCSPFPAFFSQYQAKVFVGISRPPVGDVVDPLVDPGLEEGKQRAHRHVVLVDDLLPRVAIGENGVEALADLPEPAAELRRLSRRDADPSRCRSSSRDNVA